MRERFELRVMRIMRPGILLGVLLAVGVLAQPACARQTPSDPYAAYVTGDYDGALAALRAPADAAQRRLLVRVLLELGRYEEAERAALDGGSPETVPAELANVAGEALRARGRLQESEALFARGAAVPGADALRARLNHAVALWDRGAREEARAAFDAFIDSYNSGAAQTADELTTVATGVRYLGASDWAYFQDAVRAYGEAAQLDARHAESRLLQGELFLEKFNSTEATALFREVLAVNPRHPRALLGMARARAFDGTDESLAFVDSSLAVNPNYVDARVFRARLLLGLERSDDAASEVATALAVNAASLPALAMKGAVHFLTNDRRGYEDAKRRALQLNPRFSGFDITVAELAAQQRRYRDAVELARAGLVLDASDWSGLAVLGLTQLRLGEPDSARATLEASFGGDPYNVWVKNTLDLLDTYPHYVSRRSDRFDLFLHGDEAELLALYMTPLAEEAYATLSRRYGAEAELPIRVEAYPRSADFSVRTVGLSGLGALGVAFGSILAMDSPAARDIGDFNWGSTLWHEISHAITLGASNSRVPRWLTEGIAVFDERRARDGWGEGLRLDFLAALKQDRLLPVSGLNAGFVRPTYPGQVVHAYYQASLVAEMIEQKHGERALRDMLRAYAQGRTTSEVFRDVLRTEMRAFDTTFEQWLRQKYATQLAAITVPPARSGSAESPGAGTLGGPYIDALVEARRALGAGDAAAAQRAADRAVALIPEHAGDGSPYRVLYRVHEQRGDARRAIEALRSQVRHNSSDYAAHIELARLLEQQGDRAGAADVLERAMYIYPYEPQLHTRMAELYAAAGQHAKAVRERRAVLALAPVNRADALYRLAVALDAAGERDEARRQVVRALEIAPNFAEAQELLLRVRGGGS